jgi:hypothetical protein
MKNSFAFLMKHDYHHMGGLSETVSLALFVKRNNSYEQQISNILVSRALKPLDSNTNYSLKIPVVPHEFGDP